MKMLSIKLAKEAKTINKMNEKLKRTFFLINNNLGENVFKPSKKIVEIVTVAKAIPAKQVLILSFLLFDFGK